MQKKESLANGKKSAISSEKNDESSLSQRMPYKDKLLEFITVEVDTSKMDKETAKKSPKYKTSRVAVRYLASLAISGKVIPELVVEPPMEVKYNGEVIKTILDAKTANAKLIKDLNLKADNLGIKRHGLSEQERKNLSGILVGNNRLADSFSNELQDFTAEQYGQVELLQQQKKEMRSR